MSYRLHHTFKPGYISRKKKAFISWSELCSNPASWILEECYPEAFSWADPSKLRTAQVFQLLGHWRQHEQDGVDPIIWNPLCKPLSSATIQTRQPKKRPSSPEPESPPGGMGESSEHGYSWESSDEQSGEEDFDDELQRILDEDSEDHSDSHCSITPSPSPCPHKRAQDLSEPDRVDSTSPHIQESAPYSCKQFISITSFHNIYKLYSSLITSGNFGCFTPSATAYRKAR